MRILTFILSGLLGAIVAHLGQKAGLSISESFQYVVLVGAIHSVSVYVQLVRLKNDIQI